MINAANNVKKILMVGHIERFNPIITQFKKFIKDLSTIRGRHTELVSVYIPAGYDIIKIIQHLSQEQGTASNIKDKTTRTHVIDSLEKMIRHLRLFKQTPPNGLVVFSGNISKKESQTDIQVFSIEPPQSLKLRMYRCDQTFVLEPLEEMLEDTTTYGLIVIDRREADIGLLKGTSIKTLSHSTSDVPGKTRAGGQSAKRFESLRKLSAIDFYKRISDKSNKEFLQKKELKGILLGGPGLTKEEFLEYLNTELKNKVMAIKDLSYTGDFGLKELVEKSKDVLVKEEIIEEKEIVNRFLKLLATATEKVAYGIAEVKKALEIGAVEILLISESLEDVLIESLEESTSQTGAELRMISTDTTEGKQLKDLGGVAAILRFPIS